MDRRQFFRNTLQKAARTVVQQGDARVTGRARRWIRPPYAIAELEFLLSCTRCSECITACPHGIVFALAARLGADVAGTPALDLLHKGCHLCADWPCVTACGTGALKLPESRGEAGIPKPLMARVRIDTASCLPYQGPECGVCVSACLVPGAIRLENEKPVIDEAQCTGCALCREACIVEAKAITVSSVHALQGDGGQ